jgi:thiol-disulfide isomerase/thioredoxin
MAPALAQVESAFAGQVRLVRINVDEEPERVAALGVRSIPTLILQRDGREVGRHRGALSPTDLHALFAGLAAGTPPATGPSQSDRTVRLVAGVLVALLGLLLGLGSLAGWLFLGLGAVTGFSAIHDRCPIWQALRRGLGMGAAPGA